MLLSHETFVQYEYKIEDLTSQSSKFVVVKCDYCGQHYSTTPKKRCIAHKYIQKDACPKCKNCKRVDINLLRYGVVNTSHLQSVKDKIRNTNIDRLQSDEYKQQIKKTNLSKYGCENVMHNDAIKQKQQKSFMDTYSNSKQKKVAVITKRERNLLCKINEFKPLLETAENKEMLRLRLNDTKDKINLWLQTLDMVYDRDFIICDNMTDFVLYDAKIIIIINGLYWHSEAVQPDYLYHVKKRQAYIDAGYTPLFFREDEIENKFGIVKSIILNKLGKSQKIGARQCEVKEIDRGVGYNFIRENHLMGATMQGRYFGLMYSGELICLLCILRRQGDEYEISRFCPKIGYQIVGGFSKLIKFAQQYISMKKLITFIDLRYGTGDYLTNLGFKQTSCHPSFRWTNGSESFHRLRYTGNTGYEVGHVKSWDCGQAKWCIIP